MEIKNEYPPNYELIKLALNPPPHTVFCYGETIYNPSGREIPPDLEHHEAVHSRQQAGYPDAWWAKYLTDADFRLSQELEAYGEQYLFAKELIEAQAEEAAKQGKVLSAGKTRLLKWALEGMASALSSETYGTLITYGEAESKIRNYSKA